MRPERRPEPAHSSREKRRAILPKSAEGRPALPSPLLEQLKALNPRGLGGLRPPTPSLRSLSAPTIN